MNGRGGMNESMSRSSSYGSVRGGRTARSRIQWRATLVLQPFHGAQQQLWFQFAAAHKTATVADSMALNHCGYSNSMARTSSGRFGGASPTRVYNLPRGGNSYGGQQSYGNSYGSRGAYGGGSRGFSGYDSGSRGFGGGTAVPATAVDSAAVDSVAGAAVSVEAAVAAEVPRWRRWIRRWRHSTEAAVDSTAVAVDSRRRWWWIPRWRRRWAPLTEHS